MTLRPCPGTVADLLPHRPPMLLLDEALGWNDTEVAAAATIGPHHPFLGPEGVPSHVGIELMAQACGVHVGAQAVAGGRPVRLGFLLGTRRFHATCDWFRPGERLVVTASVVIGDAEMAVYDCRISRDGETIAEASLNLYQPKDAQAVLKGTDV